MSLLLIAERSGATGTITPVGKYGLHLTAETDLGQHVTGPYDFAAAVDSTTDGSV